MDSSFLGLKKIRVGKNEVYCKPTFKASVHFQGNNMYDIGPIEDTTGGDETEDVSGRVLDYFLKQVNTKSVNIDELFLAINGAHPESLKPEDLLNIKNVESKASAEELLQSDLKAKLLSAEERSKVLRSKLNELDKEHKELIDKHNEKLKKLIDMEKLEKLCEDLKKKLKETDKEEKKGTAQTEFKLKEMENEIKLKNEQLDRKKKSHKEKVSKYMEKIGELEASISNSALQLIEIASRGSETELFDDIEYAISLVESLIKDLTESLETARNGIKKRDETIMELTNKITKLQEEGNKESKERIAKLRGQRENLKSENDAQRLQIIGLNGDKQRLEIGIGKLKKDNDRLKEEVEGLKFENVEIKKMKEEKSNEMFKEITVQLKEKTESLKESLKQLKLIKSEKQKSNDEVERLKSELEKMKGKEEKTKIAKSELMKKFEKQKAETESARSDIEKIRHQLKEHRQESNKYLAEASLANMNLEMVRKEVKDALRVISESLNPPLQKAIGLFQSTLQTELLRSADDTVELAGKLNPIASAIVSLIERITKLKEKVKLQTVKENALVSEKRQMGFEIDDLTVRLQDALQNKRKRDAETFEQDNAAKRKKRFDVLVEKMQEQTAYHNKLGKLKQQILKQWQEDVLKKGIGSQQSKNVKRTLGFTEGERPTYGEMLDIEAEYLALNGQLKSLQEEIQEMNNYDMET